MRDADDFINNIIREFFNDGPMGGAIKTNEDHYGRRYYNDTSDHITEDDEYIYICFELKKNKEDYEVIAREEVVVIHLITSNDQIVYRLPCKVDPKSMEYTHNNYVMDITLRKIKEENKNDDE